MADYTLTYSEGSKGFPSFYSYYPDWMIGMNNYFYSFKGGNLYRHNTNETRNTYYGTTYSSTITTVLNKQPLENKLFKTLAIEGTDAWTAEILTDVEAQEGLITAVQFQEKEGNYFAYVRNVGIGVGKTILTESDYKLRTLVGFGAATYSGVNYVGVDGPVPNIPSIGDYLYAENGGFLSIVGDITNIGYDQNLLATVISYNLAPTGTAPAVGQYVYCVKDAAAESMGVMGHYAEVKLTLPSSITAASELFALGSDVMKSYP